MTTNTTIEVICDKCRGKIPEKSIRYRLNIITKKMNPENAFEVEDMCMDCYNELKDYLNKETK